jgi:hypothetical protein
MSRQKLVLRCFKIIHVDNTCLEKVHETTQYNDKEKYRTFINFIHLTTISTFCQIIVFLLRICDTDLANVFILKSIDSLES